MYLAVAAAQVGDDVLYGPIVGIALVAAEVELEDVPVGRQISQVEDGIDVPLVPHGCLVALHGQREVRHQLPAERLAEAGIQVERLLAAARPDVVRQPGFFILL